MKRQVLLGLRVCARGRFLIVGILDGVGKDSRPPIARLTLPPRPWERIEPVAGVSWAVKNKRCVSWPCSESRFSFLVCRFACLLRLSLSASDKSGVEFENLDENTLGKGQRGDGKVGWHLCDFVLREWLLLRPLLLSSPSKQASALRWNRSVSWPGAVLRPGVKGDGCPLPSFCTRNRED